MQSFRRKHGGNNLIETIAIKGNPDLAKVDFIQPVWHFPSS